ncbi:DMT family transporter [Thiothrix eikelboomii]|uniref:DMT family transporter n=1 Tax=Thiothrix eikelboomii TaxID=92487 RepID=UPI003BAFB24D
MRESISDYSEQHNFRLGLLYALGGTALFALKSIFIKLAYAQGVDTVTLLTLRMLVAAPFYLAVLVWLIYKTQVTSPSQQDLLAILVLGALGYYVSSYFDMQGLNYISAQLERLMLYSYPIMTALLGWLLFHEAITRRLSLALVLTYSGVLLLYTYEANLGGKNISLGVLLVTLSALMFAVYLVYSKRVLNRVGSLLFTSLAMLSATVCVLIHFALTHPLSALWVNSTAWFYAGLLGVFSTVLPSFMLTEALARIGAARTSMMGTTGPMITILLAVVLLGEPFGWAHLAGMLLVLMGVSMLSKR